MKQSKAIQMFHWLEELKQLQAKRQHSALTQREQYRMEELRARLEERLAERNREPKPAPQVAPSQQLQETRAAVKNSSQLRETGDQQSFVRQQAIVTKYDSFSTLPFVTLRQAQEETQEQQHISPTPQHLPGVPPQHEPPHPQAEKDEPEDTSGDYDAFDLFHPPESLK